MTGHGEAEDETDEEDEPRHVDDLGERDKARVCSTWGEGLHQAVGPASDADEDAEEDEPSDGLRSAPLALFTNLNQSTAEEEHTRRAGAKHRVVLSVLGRLGTRAKVSTGNLEHDHEDVENDEHCG